jgi:hypothetical protein
MATKDVLIKYAPIGVAVLKTNLQKVNTTGKTAASIRAVVTDTSLKLIGRGYFAALETGRGPRKESAYGEFDNHLDEWLNAKGFSSKTSKTGVKYYKLGDQWFSAKSLAWKINKKGDKLWRKGKGAKVRDVYSSALDKFVQLLIEEIKKDKLKTVKKTVFDSLKNL